MPTTRIWTLPEINEPKLSCITIPIPDDFYHKLAFFGQLDELSKWWNWERDDAHRGIIAANVWANIAIEARAAIIGDCFGSSSGVNVDDMQLRQNGCVLEYSLDCVTWRTLYDPRLCDQLMGDKPGGSGSKPLAPGECRVFNLVVRADQQNLFPLPVSTGDRITLVTAQGAIATETPAPRWHCASGLIYFLGDCGGDFIYRELDPMPAEPHGSLIAQIGSEYVAINAGSELVIPAGHANATMLLQVNDDTYSGNAGEFVIQLKICSGAAVPETDRFDGVLDGNRKTWMSQAYINAGYSYGVIDAGVGDPLPSMVSALPIPPVGGTKGILCGVEIDLGVPRHVGSTSYSYMGNANALAFNILGYYWELIDNDGAIVASNGGTFTPGNADQWHINTINFNINAIRKVRLLIALNAPMAADSRIWLDNFIVGA